MVAVRGPAAPAGNGMEGLNPMTPTNSRFASFRLDHRLAMFASGAAMLALAASATAGSNGCPGDLDGDGSVGTPDLLALLADWGPCPAPCVGDLDGDGSVGTPDLLALLAGWGPCPGGVVIDFVEPLHGAPGDIIQIVGEFPTNDGHDACAVIKPKGGEGPVVFAPLEVEKMFVDDGGRQVMIARIGPVPFQPGEAILAVHWGDGYPVEIFNPFPKQIVVTDEGACVGDIQPQGANIIFNVDGFPAPEGPCGNDCGPGFDFSSKGSIIGDMMCVTLDPCTCPGCPGGGAYPTGTRFEIWPRYHTCDGCYVKDCGTIRFEITGGPLPASSLRLIMSALIDLELNACGAAACGFIPSVNVIGNDICLQTPGHAVCARTLHICVDLP